MNLPEKKSWRMSWGAFLLSTVASVMLVALPLILATSQVAALSDTTPPTVSITFPGNGAWVKGIQTVSVVAIDSVGISKVVLYVDGVLIQASRFDEGWLRGRCTIARPNNAIGQVLGKPIGMHVNQLGGEIGIRGGGHGP